MRINKHPETYLALADLPEQTDIFYPWKPTFGSDFINENHRFYSTGDPSTLLKFRGKICGEDATKLYEMAYHSSGDILELGCLLGLSTYVMAQAVRDSGKATKIWSVDLVQTHIDGATQNLLERKVLDYVKFLRFDGGKSLVYFEKQKQKFGFVFVDHNHSFEANKEVCVNLPGVLLPGGFVFFHDFVHRANKTGDYGVHKACHECLTGFEFYGVYGVGALYRYVQ